MEFGQKYETLSSNKKEILILLFFKYCIHLFGQRLIQEITLEVTV
jgi:hypothetical protein